MINFLNNMNLLPTNFIVANMVEVLKEDPENGIDKLYEMSQNFITDTQVLKTLGEVKSYYDSHPSIKRFIKNMIYNIDKNCLNHFLQNIAVKEVWEGIGKREKASQKYGIQVPYAIMLDIGMTCSVNCKDCYDSHDPSFMMPLNEVDQLIFQARELGIHFIILTGGDPFSNQELFKLYEKYSDVEFVVFTNGRLLSNHDCIKLVSLGNVLPMITLEGDDKEVKQQTGDLTYSQILAILDRLKSKGLLFGVITPTHSMNLKKVVSDSFILPLIRHGSRLQLYVSSYQSSNGTELNEKMEKWLEKEVAMIRQTKPYIAVHLQTYSPFIGRCVVGPLMYELSFDSIHHQVEIPQFNTKMVNGASLAQMLKQYQI